MVATSGLASTDQALPSHRSMRLWSEPFVPTAQHSLAERQVTLASVPLLVVLVGTTDQDAPFHSSARGSLKWPAAFMVDPTAQQFADATQVTPVRAAPVGLCGSAWVEPDQVDPSQWSI